MSDELKARVARLEAELRAARRTIDVLADRIEHPATADDPDRFAIHRTIASLERTVLARTKAQRASEAHYRALYDQIPDAVLTLDGGGRVLECNSSAERMLDSTSSELVGSPVSGLLTAQSASVLDGLLASRFSGTGDVELGLFDGKVLSFSLARLDGDRVILVLRDVTQRQALEAELEAARRLASVGRLAAALAQEINNPVAVINGRLDLLARQPSVSREDLDRQLAVLRDHCQRISGIARNLQTFARPQPPSRSEVGVGSAIGEAIESAGRRLARVRLTVDVQPAALAVEADRDQLVQALLNLLCLVGEGSAHGRAVDVQARAVGDTVRISVHGEGLSLPADVLHGLRAPMQAPGHALEQGAGLGLTIAWAIVQAHGGWLTAESSQPRGATVHLHLVAGRPNGPERPAAPRALSILVVDDDQLLSRTVRWMLSDAGHSVEAVRSAEDALELLARSGVDVVLTDYNLPGMDGEALIDAIEAHWPDLGESTILTSGLLHQPRRPQRYLQKPFTRARLLELVRAVSVD